MDLNRVGSLLLKRRGDQMESAVNVAVDTSTQKETVVDMGERRAAELKAAHDR